MTTIYNNNTQTIANGATIGLPTLANQKGNCTAQNGNGITARKGSMYEITGTVTGLVTGGGILSIGIAVNGVVEPYLIASGYSDTGEPTTLTINGTYIVDGCGCSSNNNANTPIFTLVNNGTTTGEISFAALNVTRI